MTDGNVHSLVSVWPNEELDGGRVVRKSTQINAMSDSPSYEEIRLEPPRCSLLVQRFRFEMYTLFVERNKRFAQNVGTIIFNMYSNHPLLVGAEQFAGVVVRSTALEQNRQKDRNLSNHNYSR